MQIIDFPQRSAAWYAARRGIPTASMFGKLALLSKKTKQFEARDSTKEWRDYKYKLVCERLGEDVDDDYQNRWMRRGIAREDDARDAYVEWRRTAGIQLDIRQVGFCKSGDGRIGCSPDGLIGDVANPLAVLEIKTPAPWTHLRYLCDGHDEEYLPQVMGQLLITNAEYAEFWSYHERWPSYHSRTHRNATLISQLQAILYRFCLEVDDAHGTCLQKGCRPLEAA